MVNAFTCSKPHNVSPWMHLSDKLQVRSTGKLFYAVMPGVQVALQVVGTVLSKLATHQDKVT